MGSVFPDRRLDTNQSAGEHRFLSIGLSEHGRLLIVSYAERADNRIRIISARESLAPGAQKL